MTMAQQQTSDPNTLNNLLAEWQHWLKWFLGDLQGDIGQMLHHLHPLLTAPRPSDNGGLLTTPGLETVLRRGNYANLLLSEWMLADSFPDEFLRRAAQHEHLFFAPPPLEDDGGKRVLALFDVGIMQLGLPRVAHIALLMLLSRRAQLLKGEFYWGIVQNEPQWHEFTNVNHLRQMLDVRQVTLITAEQLDKWRNFVEEGDKGDECWFISSQKFHDQGKSLFASHRLSIDETFKGTSLEVILHQNGRSAIEIALPLPDEKQCKRLLSAKFVKKDTQGKKQTNSLLDNSSLLWPLIISPNGKKVLLRTNGDNDRCLIEVDIDDLRPKIRKWSLPVGAKIIAAGYSFDGDISLLLKVDQDYQLWAKDNTPLRGNIQTNISDSPARTTRKIEPLIVMTDGDGLSWIARLSGGLTQNLYITNATIKPLKENLAFLDIYAVQYYSYKHFLVLKNIKENFRLEMISVKDNEVKQFFDLGPSFETSKTFIKIGYIDNPAYKGSKKFVSGMLAQNKDESHLTWLSRTKIGGEQLVETIFPLPMGCKVIGTWFDDALNVLVPVIWDHKKTIGAWRGDRFENWYSDAVKLANAEMCIYSGTIVMHSVDHDIIFFDVNSRQIMAQTGQANGDKNG
ncbi:hypothetical protein N5853_00045 [Bartonella sp. HY329]|uniref:hypothetical protein n=1 Tax=unclassified Bartonella TaxID=2645622 RepID=UPI0021C746FB|nr:MULTISPECIES: hypothetical protein [unclassified Bartonella]UXM95094.1 hypothetical protein N5853_00045 [Bartonella sp. HY329]UXN09417.1 hypothetical protein N5852_00045 [Bartonella sp. HY328]